MTEKKELRRSRHLGDCEILVPSYESGGAGDASVGRWRAKLRSRQEMIQYLKTAERYWFDSDWFGSERRDKPA